MRQYMIQYGIDQVIDIPMEEFDGFKGDGKVKKAKGKFCFEYLETLVDKYGEDSLSYLTMNLDQKIFFSKNIEGCIAYVKINRIIMCIGNPNCAKKDISEFVKELEIYSHSVGKKLCFCSITDEFLNVLNGNKYVISKYGEEARIDIRDYSIAGGSRLKLRQKVNQAERSGNKVVEYRPNDCRNIELEEQIGRVSEEWFNHKKGKLKFSVGETYMNVPLKRRYFISINQENDVQGIVTFSPYNNKKGYFLDVMHRKKDGTPGVIEHLIIQAITKFKEENVKEISLGIAPLYGINIKEKEITMLEKIMNYIYNNVQCDYDFQGLYNYKKKFAPSEWKERYIAYEKGLTVLEVIYVMIRARNAKGIAKQLIKNIYKKLCLKN